MIQMRHITKVYKKGIHALEDINVKIGRGEMVFVAGPSGSGKTTFLKLIYAEIIATTGLIFVGGKNISSLPLKEVPYLRRQIGVVYQDFKLLYQKTVFENIAFALQVIGLPSAEVYKRTIKVLNIVELTHKKDAFPHQLSGGEQQRVAIARAIVNDPALILADEPTGNLDTDLATNIMNFFMEANRQGTTLVVATHNKENALKMGAHVIHLNSGKIVK
ncbi:cell division ATP-binding protein FtsE [Candidatus Desantisbacteria bacterium CG2_30_40_21]|uniref:Cell division ATP-binding protein FtsE n=4 Tax=unclassified Candidatus Desantisiibacteriota TaxID=3106372 RepID=A0A2M7JBT1_9BACT|nr:MAG: cell division ATP-binding protein FtsE [Candidatus Desantisbacteria bacterium CG2_30_40_21]PIP42055.1 MAG: cell division ATP-binding protein FtsE [Candidatus Desantisbacteria bacterium CG23_combo_of_CG06-09_8_20_14_all_40_23]PIX16823.1 MAG: cell division ATP-binding protein FtsE [Candidatus Desantisbacteria bacterium CG_4_8_14_3_um_filter_40_12]PJB28213.1 MAG: cell division ATP-binding protein FtsE [Candidatus Desantisbacteria bacterium CG_4_9_14_3_um_filter_40_11]